MSDGITVNLDEVEAWEATGAILPPGRHACVIADVDEGTSSGGHPQLTVRSESLDPQQAGAGITDWIVITPKSLGRVRQFLEAAGVEIPEGEFKIPSAKLFDKKLTVFVKDGTKPDGTKKTEVAAYAPFEASDVPADTAGLGAGNGTGGSEPDVPF